MVPVRTYARRPRPQKGHAAIFGYPFDADGERGKAFIAAVVDAMVALMQNVSPSYEERKP
jgi:creatinine amidohydrolase